MGTFRHLVFLLAYGSALGNATEVLNDRLHAPIADYETFQPPGSILDYRSLPLTKRTLDHIPGNARAVFQIRYRTTGPLGEAQAAVTTLIVPENANVEKHLSWQRAYSATQNKCSPSYILQDYVADHRHLDTAPIAVALERGWYVSVPDYEGPEAAFGSGIQAGQATLDSVRAVMASSHFSDILFNARTAMYGYSDAAIATEWAAEMQPTYAPELNIVGAAAGALIPNLTATIQVVNRSPYAGFIALGLVGLATAYPNVSTWLDQQLLPTKERAFVAPTLKCLPRNLKPFDKKDMFRFFKAGDLALSHPVPASVLQLNGLGMRGARPTMPLYIFQGREDEISPIIETDKLYNRYCATRSVSIQYVRYNDYDHFTTELAGAAGALNWLDSVLDGRQPAIGCHVDVV